MIKLVIGGSGSGKSQYAEELLFAMPQRNKYYIATMKVWDEDGERRVARHRKQREDKGFLTIEKPTAVDEISFAQDEAGTAFLLECVSNLTANEMFADGGILPPELVADRVVAELEALIKNAGDAVIVTNNIFEDGVCYNESTMSYIRALGEINRKLTLLADEVTEVVVGIPLVQERKRSVEEDCEGI